jgi:hypothetical protein
MNCADPFPFPPDVTVDRQAFSAPSFYDAIYKETENIKHVVRQALLSIRHCRHGTAIVSHYFP